MDAKAALVPVMNAPDDLRKGLKTAIQRRCGREQPLPSDDVFDRDAGFPARAFGSQRPAYFAKPFDDAWSRRVMPSEPRGNVETDVVTACMISSSESSEL
jgi:hypothetical protein